MIYELLGQKCRPLCIYIYIDIYRPGSFLASHRIFKNMALCMFKKLVIQFNFTTKHVHLFL